MHRTIQSEEFDQALTRIPDELHDAFRAYHLTGARPSGLVAALLSGSLYDTFDRAAGAGLTEHVPALAQFVRDSLPWSAFGSADKVSRWVAQGGLKGRSPLGRRVA